MKWNERYEREKQRRQVDEEKNDLQIKLFNKQIKPLDYFYWSCPKKYYSHN